MNFTLRAVKTAAIDGVDTVSFWERARNGARLYAEVKIGHRLFDFPQDFHLDYHEFQHTVNNIHIIA